METSKTILALISASLLLTACGEQDDTHVPSVPGLMVSTENVGNFNTQLLASDIDGNGRHRIVIGKITVAPAHAQDDADLDDESKIALMGGGIFSPDGKRMILGGLMDSERSQLIVLDADGRNARTAGTPGGGFGCAVVWSPDMTRIAYCHSDYGASNPRVAITDLRTDEVTEPGWNGMCPAIRWDLASSGFYCAGYDAGTDSSSLSHFSIATRQINVVQSNVPGEIEDISEDADFALIVRKPATGGRALVRRRFSTGEERLIFQSPDDNIGGRFVRPPDQFIAYAHIAGDSGPHYVHIGASAIAFTKMQVPAGTYVGDFYPE